MVVLALFTLQNSGTKMAKHYVTFGQVHTHMVNGKTLDCNTVAVFEAESYEDGRGKAFKYFGDKFFTDYHDSEWDESKLIFYPKGYVFLWL